MSLKFRGTKFSWPYILQPVKSVKIFYLENFRLYSKHLPRVGAYQGYCGNLVQLRQEQMWCTHVIIIITFNSQIYMYIYINYCYCFLPCHETKILKLTESPFSSLVHVVAASGAG